MEYKEAQELALKKKWKVETCTQGLACWCRLVVPEEKIKYISGNIEEELYIIGSGAINKIHAEHIVKIHNDTLNL